MQILEEEARKKGEIAGNDIPCNECNKRPAEIFQATVDCWQALTHTNA